MELTKQALDKLGLRSRSLVDENNVRQAGTASWVGQDGEAVEKTEVTQPGTANWRDNEGKGDWRDGELYQKDEFPVGNKTINWLFMGFGNDEKPELLNFLKKKYGENNISETSVTTLGVGGGSDIEFDLYRLQNYIRPRYQRPVFDGEIWKQMGYDRGYFRSLKDALNNKHVENIFKKDGDFQIKKRRHTNNTPWLPWEVRRLPRLHHLHSIVPSVNDIFEPYIGHFDAIVWENGIRAGRIFPCMNVESLELFYRMLKSDGKFYLPHAVAESNIMNGFFTLTNRRFNLDIKTWSGGDQKHRESRNYWMEFTKNEINTSKYSLKDANGVRQHAEPLPSFPKGVKELGMVDGDYYDKRDEKQDNEWEDHKNSIKKFNTQKTSKEIKKENEKRLDRAQEASYALHALKSVKPFQGHLGGYKPRTKKMKSRKKKSRKKKSRKKKSRKKKSRKKKTHKKLTRKTL